MTHSARNPCVSAALCRYAFSSFASCSVCVTAGAPFWCRSKSYIFGFFFLFGLRFVSPLVVRCSSTVLLYDVLCSCSISGFRLLFALFPALFARFVELAGLPSSICSAPSALFARFVELAGLPSSICSTPSALFARFVELAGFPSSICSTPSALFARFVELAGLPSSICSLT